MNFPAREIQLSRNQESRSKWAQYAPHRERITQLLTQSCTGGKLLILGAGNCNDIDLKSLLNHFAEIQLLDLDAEALRYGISHQGWQAHPNILLPNIVLHGGVDVTGIEEICSLWNPQTPPDADVINAALHKACSYTLKMLEHQFDVTASIGLLSQVTEMIIQSLGASHVRVMELLSAVRLRHMQILLEATRPGGRAFLVTEIVSSSTCPELAQTPEAALPELLQRLISSRNFFTGLNPGVLHSLWLQSPALTPLVERVELSWPWLWDFGSRVFACCALTGIRK